MNNDPEIISVKFLTPAKISYKINGEVKESLVSVDLINKKVYDEKGLFIFNNLVFEHLDMINTLPDDFFANSESDSQEYINLHKGQ